MKTKLTLSLLIFISFIGFGQTKYGVKAGINFSKFTPNLKFNNDEILDYSLKNGGHVGFYMNYKVSDNFKLQPELLFKLEGSKATHHTNSKYNISDYIISLPLTLQYKIYSSFYMETGININYIFKKQETINFSPNIFPDPKAPPGGQQTFTISGYDAFDIGYLVGFGYYFTDKISANVRYSHSLNKRDSNIKSSVFNLGMAYDLF